MPDTCGDGQNISYPFYIPGNRKPYCGYPGFELSCNNNGQPTIVISGTAYIVQKIFYRNQTLRVSNSAFSNTTIDCIPLTRNVSLPGVRFDLAPNQTRLFLLYNCNSSLLEHPSEFYRGCYEEKETRSVLALPEGDLKLRNASQACRSAAVAPIESYGVNGDGIRGVLIRRGFLLKWKGTSCSICQESGGLCGFNHTTYNSRCLCADRPHLWHCRPGQLSLSVLDFFPSSKLSVYVHLTAKWIDVLSCSIPQKLFCLDPFNYNNNLSEPAIVER